MNFFEEGTKMMVQFNYIVGLSIGFEIFQDEDYGEGVMLDLFLFRVILFFNALEEE